MTSATAELQKTVFKRLAGDPELQSLLGGVHVFDHVPTRVSLPYVALGRASADDWSTSTEPGSEHTFTVHVWSEAYGRDEVHNVQERVKTLLLSDDLDLEGHHLVNLTLEYSESRRPPNETVLHGLMRFRAVTEPQV